MRSKIYSLFFSVALLPIFSAAPAYEISNPRAAAEWEKVQGVAMVWDEEDYIQTLEIVREHGGWTVPLRAKYDGLIATQTGIINAGLEEGIKVYLLDDTTNDYRVQDTLTSWGISSPNLIIVPYNKNYYLNLTIWMRDVGPFGIYENQVGTLNFLGWNKDDGARVISSFLGTPLTTFSNDGDFFTDGGNYLTDGHAKLFCDTKWGNPSGYPELISDFGFSQIIALPPYKIHLDYYMKLINEELMFISEIPSSNYIDIDYERDDSAKLELAIQTIGNTQSYLGRPYRIVRIKNAPSINDPSLNLTYFTADASYINSLILNGTVIVPTFDNPATDSVAINTYKKYLPGYKIVAVPCKYYAPAAGAVHCLTREIVAEEPIFISHAWYPDTITQTTDYEIKALIQTASGVNQARLYWSTDPQNGYQLLNMTDVGNDSFQAFIPGQPEGTKVHYYIEAVANSSKIARKPIVAPDWAYNFLVYSSTCLAKPGDAKGDGKVNLSDIIFQVNYVFKGGIPPDPFCRGDDNADGKINLSDIIYGVNFIFKGGPAPIESGVCCL